MKNKKNKGFTLIELLVVIAIIGILAAIGLSALTSARKKARDSKRKSDLREVANALELYYSDNGRYPSSATFSALTTPGGPLSNYLSTPPKDPLTPTTDYCYGPSNDYLFYRVGAVLEVTTDQSMVVDGGASNSKYEIGNATGTNAGLVPDSACKT